MVLRRHGLMVVLLGMAAFGTDLAWFYLNASRVQRAAEPARCVGVVWLPGQIGTANTTAVSVAKQNGYDVLDPEVDVTSGVVGGEANQLQVTVRDVVPTFFAQIFGFNDMAIERSAIAELHPAAEAGEPLQPVRQQLRPHPARLHRAGQLLGQHPRQIHRYGHGRRLLLLLHRGRLGQPQLHPEQLRPDRWLSLWDRGPRLIHRAGRGPQILQHLRHPDHQ